MNSVYRLLTAAACWLLTVPCLAAGPYSATTETVTDQSTSLMWQRQPPATSYDWQQALAYCEALSLAGYDDWRLPGIRELMSIIDYSRATPYLDPVFAGGVSNYWSSTTNAATPSEAWGVFFYDGDAAWYDKSSTSNSVRCVRGGLPVDYSFTLSLQVDGGGSGVVEILPAGEDCSQSCQQRFRYGTLVMLRAKAGAGSSFAGWSLPQCSGETCTFTIYEDMDIRATFFKPGYQPQTLLLLR